MSMNSESQRVHLFTTRRVVEGEKERRRNISYNALGWVSEMDFRSRKQLVTRG